MPLHVIWLAIMLACIGYVPARAELPQCMATADLYASLAKDYGETRLAYGIDPRGSMIETWANLATGTWSIVVTRPSGVSCFGSSGQGFTLDPVGATKGDPA